MSVRARTIRVWCVINTAGQVGVAVMRQDWKGPRRLDTRLMGMREVPAADPRPLGVDEDLWTAYQALRHRVLEQAKASGQSLRY